MAEVRGDRQRERAEARQQRRSQSEEPAQQLDDGGGSEAGGLDLRRAFTTAATAAVLGGLAGAAKALADKRGSKPTAEADEDEPADGPVEQPEDEGSGDERDDSSQEESEDSGDEREEPDDAVDPRQEADDDDDDQENERAAASHVEQNGAQGGEVGKMIARAKQHVEQVLGAEPESVSGIDRSNGSWHVSVEVVQMRRVPESTDVLASYAVVLDGDGDLISLHETRRYRRSQGDDR